VDPSDINNYEICFIGDVVDAQENFTELIEAGLVYKNYMIDEYGDIAYKDGPDTLPVFLYIPDVDNEDRRENYNLKGCGNQPTKDSSAKEAYIYELQNLIADSSYQADLGELCITANKVDESKFDYNIYDEAFSEALYELGLEWDMLGPYGHAATLEITSVPNVENAEFYIGNLAIGFCN